MGTTLQQQGVYTHGAKVIQSSVHGGLIPVHGGLSPLHGANGSLDLGAELVLNGSFSANTAGWATNGFGTITWDPSGQLKYTTDGTAGAAAQQIINIVNGAKYYFNATMAPGNTVDKARIGVSGFGGEVWNFDANGGTISSVLVATGVTTGISLQVANSGAWGALNDFALFDNVSLKRVL